MNRQNMLNYPLSSDEMVTLNPDAKLIIYTDLNKCFDIEDMFKDTDKLIILYLLQSKTSGHWVCLFKSPVPGDHGKMYFNFFDSYGVPEDEQLDRLTHRQRVEFNERQDRLRLLLRKHLVIYNNVCLQGPHTDTCGMFVTNRLHHSDLTAEQYVQMLLNKDVKDPDKYVAEYVLDLFKK